MSLNTKELKDEFCATCEDIRYSFSKYGRVPLTVIRWLLVVIVPIILGAYLSVIIEQYIILCNFPITWENVIFNYPFFILCLLFVVGWIWKIHRTHTDLQLERLYHALRWLYEDLGFGNDPSADIRCTLWTPVDSKVSLQEMKLIQLVDYVPKYGNSTGLMYWYRVNKHSGRIRKIARVENGIAKPIGIAGRCIFESSRDHKPRIMYESLDGRLSFTDCMIQVWNFTKAETRRLTQDRQSYICLVLMDSGQTDILGILYADSKKLNTFTGRIANKMQNYLPRIAELLVD